MVETCFLLHEFRLSELKEKKCPEREQPDLDASLSMFARRGLSTRLRDGMSLPEDALEIRRSTRAAFRNSQFAFSFSPPPWGEGREVGARANSSKKYPRRHRRRRSFACEAKKGTKRRCWVDGRKRNVGTWRVPAEAANFAKLSRLTSPAYFRCVLRTPGGEELAHGDRISKNNRDGTVSLISRTVSQTIRPARSLVSRCRSGSCRSRSRFSNPRARNRSSLKSCKVRMIRLLADLSPAIINHPPTSPLPPRVFSPERPDCARRRRASCRTGGNSRTRQTVVTKTDNATILVESRTRTRDATTLESVPR